MTGQAKSLEIDIPAETEWRMSWNYNMTEFAEKVAENKKDGYRVHDLEVYNQRGNTVYGAIFHKRLNERGWWTVWSKSFDDFNTTFNEKKEVYRMTDIEVINEKDEEGKTKLTYSGVWVENQENLGWVARWNLTEEEWRKEYVKYVEQGYRPIDLEVYEYDDVTYYAVVWVENKHNIEWDIIWGVDHLTYKDKFQDMVEKDYLPVEMESYLIKNQKTYAGIWQTNVRGDDWHARWNLSNTEYDEYSDEFQGKGRRPLDFYSYSQDGKNPLWRSVDSERRGQEDSAQATRPDTTETDSHPHSTNSETVHRAGENFLEVGLELHARGVERKGHRVQKPGLPGPRHRSLQPTRQCLLCRSVPLQRG